METDMKRYTDEHEWVEVRDDLAWVGISAYAAEELGDITFVELPELDTKVEKGDVLSAIESVKAASDVYSPATGVVAEANGTLEEHPELVNESPEDQAWVCKLSGVNAEELEELMTPEQYQEYIKK
jgi:glycine cleavage system H protein